jgi:hypothetical protein
MPFSVKAYVDDHPISLKFETAKEAFAKAVEWHVVERFKDVSIDDSAKSYSLAEFSSVIEGEMKALLFPAHDLPDDTPLNKSGSLLGSETDWSLEVSKQLAKCEQHLTSCY